MVSTESRRQYLSEAYPALTVGDIIGRLQKLVEDHPHMIDEPVVVYDMSEMEHNEHADDNPLVVDIDFDPEISDLCETFVLFLTNPSN